MEESEKLVVININQKIKMVESWHGSKKVQGEMPGWHA